VPTERVANGALAGPGPPRPSPASRPPLRSPEALLLIAVSLASACASGGLPPPGVAEKARGISSYSASLRATLRGAQLRGGTRVLLAFRRPDALRLEIPGPTGARLVAVARGGRLTAVFPAERAVFEGAATAAEMDALVGVALSPEELIDLLVGVGAPRLKAYQARWGPALPRDIQAVLPDGSRLRARVDEAEAEPELPVAAFAPPSHAGYRRVDVEEARRLWTPR